MREWLPLAELLLVLGTVLLLALWQLHDPRRGSASKPEPGNPPREPRDGGVNGP